MPFIGQQPTTGAFLELDSLTASATANYTLQLNGANYYPESVNNLLVSINGVIQGSSTMSLNGAVLTVGATLSASDVIDFVRVFGNVGTISTPTDGSVTANKIGTGAVTDAKIATGAVTDAKIATMSSSKLTGALPSSVTSSGIYIGGTGSANYLDDYEEGTWTPSVSGNTTYNDQRGRYVKIGNQVTLWFYIRINQRNSPGVPYIAGGSPFTNSSAMTGSGLVHFFQSIQNSAVVLTARIDPGGANINISGSTGSATTVANVNHDWVGNGSEIFGFVTHYVGS